MADSAPEELKVDPELAQTAAAASKQPTADTGAAKSSGLKRRNSRFDLEKEEDDDTAEKSTLYRPEFGQTAGAAGASQEKMWELMQSYIGSDQRSIQRSIVNHVEYTLARTRFNFDDKGAYQATAYSVRDRLIEAWNDTNQYHTVRKSALINLDTAI